MFVKLLGLKNGKQYVMGEVRASDGTVQTTGELPPPILKELTALREHAKSDEAFLKQLPTNFSGAYVRGQLVQD